MGVAAAPRRLREFWRHSGWDEEGDTRRHRRCSQLAGELEASVLASSSCSLRRCRDVTYRAVRRHHPVSPWDRQNEWARKRKKERKRHWSAAHAPIQKSLGQTLGITPGAHETNVTKTRRRSLIFEIDLPARFVDETGGSIAKSKLSKKKKKKQIIWRTDKVLRKFFHIELFWTILNKEATFCEGRWTRRSVIALLHSRHLEWAASWSCVKCTRYLWQDYERMSVYIWKRR